MYSLQFNSAFYFKTPTVNANSHSANTRMNRAKTVPGAEKSPTKLIKDSHE